MSRAVLSGMGIVSPIGVGCEEVLTSLRNGTPGIGTNESFVEAGLRCTVSGLIDPDIIKSIDRKLLRFMGDASAYCYLAVLEALEMAGLRHEDVANDRTGVITGLGIGSAKEIVRATKATLERGVRRVGPYAVTKSMASTATAVISTALKIKGRSYAISSACSTSSNCIAHAAELVEEGRLDCVIAGGGEEIDWSIAALFDGMGAVSTSYGDKPETSSRAYDKNRDGFVPSGGAGMVIVESEERCLARGGKPLAYLAGRGATSDGADMVAPNGDGAARCMLDSLQGVDVNVGYINTHGTSTPAGDIVELHAIKEVFESLGRPIPKISSTKSMTGHALGGAGSMEAVYSTLMLLNGFVTPSINIDELDEGAEGFPIVTATEDVELEAVMTNSFGFGGTNSTLVISK